MKRHGWCLVVVGDKKGPFKYNVEEAETDAIDFLPHEEQEQIIRKNSSVSKFAQSIPWNHFGRKNLGYLYAVSQGATVIWDFDDDNMVTAEEFPPDLENGMKKVLWAPGPGAREGNVSALNIYHTMGCAASPCWPRGFPLSLASQRLLLLRSGSAEILLLPTKGLPCFSLLLTTTLIWMPCFASLPGCLQVSTSKPLQ